MSRGRDGSTFDEQAMHEVQALLDSWSAPEPSAWFDSRMSAQFREELKRPPEGFFARLRDRFLFNANMTARPMLAGALALVLATAGGSYAGFTHLRATEQPAAVSATVQDLQLIENNEQAIQQMDQLLDTGNDDGDPSQS